MRKPNDPDRLGLSDSGAPPFDHEQTRGGERLSGDTRTVVDAYRSIARARENMDRVWYHIGMLRYAGLGDQAEDFESEELREAHALVQQAELEMMTRQSGDLRELALKVVVIAANNFAARNLNTMLAAEAFRLARIEELAD